MGLDEMQDTLVKYVRKPFCSRFSIKNSLGLYIGILKSVLLTNESTRRILPSLM